MISLEMLEKRKAELERERDGVFAQFQAYGGAIQDCDYWIGLLKKGDEPPLTLPLFPEIDKSLQSH